MKKNKLMTLFVSALMVLGVQSVSADVTYTLLSATRTNDNEGAEKLLDGKGETKWGESLNNGNTRWIVFKASAGIKPSDYVLTVANDTPGSKGRQWQKWRIYGANFVGDASATRDAAGWVLLDSKENITDEQFPTGETNNSYLQTTFTLSEECDSYYEYFKIEVDEIRQSGQYMQMGDFAFGTYSEETTAELYTTKVEVAKGLDITGLDADDVWSVEAPKLIDGLTDALESAKSSGDYTALQSELNLAAKMSAAIAALVSNGNISAFDGSACWGDGHYSQLFDGKDGREGRDGTKWGGNFNGAPYQYVIFRIKEAFAPYFYRLVTGGDTGRFNGRNWKTWSVYGANFTSFKDATPNNEGWVELDKRVDISEEYLPMENNYPAAFNFTEGVSEPYLYFMVKVFAAHEGDATQMNEMSLCTKEEYEATRKPLVAYFDDFDVDNLETESSLAEDKETFKTKLEELKTTDDPVVLTKCYNELVELRKKFEESAAFISGAYRPLDGNTAWGANENHTKLIDGDEKTKWGGGMPNDGSGSYVIFKVNKSTKFTGYELITGNDTKSSPGRNWKTWKIYGCNIRGDMDELAVRDFSQWALLDEKTDIGQDQLPADNFAPAYFSFSETPAAYTYFKIEVEAPYSGDAIQMSEFKMFTEDTWKAECKEYVDSLVRLEKEAFGKFEISEAIQKEIAAAEAAVADAQPEDLLSYFNDARELILGAVKRSYAEAAKGDAECILPSLKWGGDYKAFTYVAQGDFEFGDWNESNPNYNKIIGVPEKQNGISWFDPDYNIADWNYGQDLPNFGDGRPADVYAVRYFTVDGEIPATVYMPAPHDDAPCEYYINGELIWSETDGWKEDEVVRLTDSQKALIKTDGSVNVFAFHVHQNWGGRYADGGLYTAGNMVNDFNNTASALEATLALAEKEGIDAAVIEFAKARINYRAGRDKALAQLRKARRLAADARTENFKGTEPKDGLVAYIFNVGAKMFLAGGNDWGTHASLNHMGAKCVLHTNTTGENRYAIQTNLPNGIRGNNDWLGHNGYVDCGVVDLAKVDWAWEFQPVGDGSYRIINSQNSGNNIYLGMTDDERLQVDTDKSGADNAYNKWLLVTPEEFLALAAEANKENPVDLGHLIHQATFSQNDFDGDDKGAANADLNASAWERNAGSIWNWKGNDAAGDYMFEMWNTAEVGKVYLVQEVEGLPAGQYTVSMTGYYRDGNFESAIAGNNRQLAYLFAGSESNRVLLPSILEGAGQMPGYGREGNGIVIPDGCRDAAKFFQVGTYTTTVNAVVGADGKLKIGVYRDAEDVKGGDWIVTDNWRLFYKGNYVEATITDAGYATFVAPGFIDDIPAGVEAYAAQLKEGYVHLEPTSVIPAGEAVVLKGAEGTYTFYPQAVSETPVSTSEYSIDLSYTKGDVCYDDGVAIINGEADCKVLKIGTSKAVGNFTLTVPAGKYSFYAVAWKGTGTSDVVLKNGDEVVKTVTVQANDGVTGNSPYTINVTNADKYEFEVASDCTLTVTSDKRVVFFGIKSAAASNIVLDNDLKPATEEVTADGTQYILAKLNDVAGFAKATPDTKIAAGKGYLVIKGAAGIKEFYPFGEEDATGINTIDNEQITIDNGAVYNLSGQRVNKAQKGIYIVNGKKILK